MKVDKKQLSGEALRAFMDTIGFGEDGFDEDLGLGDEDLDEAIEIPDYDLIYNEELISQRVNEMLEAYKNEPLEESDWDRIDREADEIIESRFNRAYDYFYGLVETRYENVDEGNMPLDEDILDQVSCKYNCDKEDFKSKLLERMKGCRGE